MQVIRAVPLLAEVDHALGGLEECVPTVRGTPDHGDAWSRPWHESGVDCPDFTLRRSIGQQDGAVVADYELTAERVDVSARDAAARTGLILFEPRTADITRVLYYRSGSAGSLLSAEDVRRAFDAGVPRIVHLTGITCALSDTALAAVTEAVRLGHEAGSTVSFDVNFRAKLWSPDVAAKVIRPLLKHVDVVIASDDELPIIGDHDIAEVVVKHGANGAPARTSEGTWTVPAHRVTAVDTTGDWQGLPTRTDLDLLDLQPGSTVR